MTPQKEPGSFITNRKAVQVRLSSRAVSAALSSAAELISPSSPSDGEPKLCDPAVQPVELIHRCTSRVTRSMYLTLSVRRFAL